MKELLSLEGTWIVALHICVNIMKRAHVVDSRKGNIPKQK